MVIARSHRREWSAPRVTHPGSDDPCDRPSSMTVLEPKRRTIGMNSIYTWDQVRQHMSPGDLWLVIDRKVYDVSRWMEDHPGGPEVMLQEAGKDASNAFAEIGHSLYAEGLLKDYYIGDLAG